ncbi:MAG: S41 family peptidase [Bacteroidales bacterium]
MRKICITVIVNFLAIFSVCANNTHSYFLSAPTLSPNGDEIVFSYENDLWKVPISGGVAYRLTAMEGKESLPRFSPDGEWIAFTASQNGRENIYVMPSKGGDIKQLTFHDASDHVDSWSWDSEYIYFSSDRYNMYSSYKVSVNGGTPKLLFKHFFNNPHHLVQHPISGDYFFTDSWESFMFPQRKHYKGAHSPQILSYNKITQEFKKNTQYIGKDMWPTIDKHGNLFFVSDEFNNEYNLYQLINGEKELLTQFESSIDRPQVSADGSRVVFEKDYQIWIYDTNEKTAQKVPISLFSSNLNRQSQSFNAKGEISYFDISPDNKKIAFVSRGELFVSDIEGEFIKKIKTNLHERVQEVKWKSDSKTLVYSQTHKGWFNWFAISAHGKDQEKQLTFDDKTNRLISLNSDRSKGVFLSGRNDVVIMDMDSYEVEVIQSDEVWAFQNSGPSFSPDDQYIAYTAYRNFEQDIFIYHLPTKRTINITNTGVTENDPFWSPDGDYLYFTADRLKPSYPQGTSNSSIYRIPLYRFLSELKQDQYNNLFDDIAKDTIPKVKLDLTNIAERWEEISVKGGEQASPYIYKQKDETVLLFISNHDKGEQALWKKVFKPFEQTKTERLSSFSTSGYQAVRVKNGTYLLADGNIYKMHSNGKELEPVEVDYTFSKSIGNEFAQMFFETWAILQENFYDDNFHGVDWAQKRDYYATFLPYVRHRDNLRRLLNDMLGELNASHMGFRSDGDEEKTFYSAYSASVGVLFNNQNPYQVERIIARSNADLTDQQIKPGDILLAVNDEQVDKNVNREYYFSFPSAPSELTLTFVRDGKEFTVTKPTHTSSQLKGMFYDEWIANNRDYVHDKSNGKVAYVHMKDMGMGSYRQFYIDMTTYADKADALVFDLRYNRGGNVHDDVLNFLARKPYLQWSYREGATTGQPNFAPAAKPMILVMNEHSLSDAEMTAAGFRQLKLGKLLGTETYRWIIFTSGKSLVDGSFVRVPAWGCYTLDGDNLELTGVAPDIYIDTNFKNRLNDNDPQLDRAIEEMLKEL